MQTNPCMHAIGETHTKHEGRHLRHSQRYINGRPGNTLRSTGIHSFKVQMPPNAPPLSPPSPRNDLECKIRSESHGRVECDIPVQFHSRGALSKNVLIEVMETGKTAKGFIPPNLELISVKFIRMASVGSTLQVQYNCLRSPPAFLLTESGTGAFRRWVISGNVIALI